MSHPKFPFGTVVTGEIDGWEHHTERFTEGDPPELGGVDQFQTGPLEGFPVPATSNVPSYFKYIINGYDCLSDSIEKADGQP